MIEALEIKLDGPPCKCPEPIVVRVLMTAKTTDNLDIKVTCNICGSSVSKSINKVKVAVTW